MASPRAGGTPSGRPTAIVVAGDEETRLLLRGLLRLHHVQVVGEAEGSTQGMSLLKAHQPSLLIADASLAEGSFASLVAGAREPGHPIRVILVTSDRRRTWPGMGVEGPDVILTRPFHMQEFAEVLRLPQEPIPTEAVSSST
jgi:DNA-binding NarL/FixJ family response regulator